jgi:hypothetical protein
MKPTWRCSCGCTEFVFAETADVSAAGCIDENGEFTSDDILGYKVTERAEYAACAECGREYRLAGTQGGKQ